MSELQRARDELKQLNTPAARARLEEVCAFVLASLRVFPCNVEREGGVFPCDVEREGGVFPCNVEREGGVFPCNVQKEGRRVPL